MTENEKRDYQKYYVRDADGFSAERNQKIIDETIKDYEKFRAKKLKAQKEALAERIDAAASFIMHLEKTDLRQDSALRYFGKRELARLQGKKIKQVYMNNVIKLFEGGDSF